MDPNVEAVRNACTEHVDALFGSARRLTGNDAEASDLVQDTYIKVLRFADKFRPGTNLRAWMTKILVNTFINKHRRKTKERRTAEEFADEPGYETFYSRDEQRRLADPEAAIFGRLVRNDIHRALDAMAPEFRTVVVLADVEEMSYREIADVMDCPVGTVMSRLFRARRQLRGLLQGQAADAGIAEAVRAEGSAGGAGPEAVIDFDSYRKRRTAGTRGGES